jgi:Mrp family chromosome partitioning ATPase
LNLSTDGPEVGSVLSNGSFHGRDFQRCKDLDLFVLCGRPTSGDKPAVLDLTAVYTYLQELKEACDYIIIDTSACGAFADALQMGSCSDGVILNVQQDNSSLYQIRYVLEQLAGVGASVDGYVMNQYQRGVVDLV